MKKRRLRSPDIADAVVMTTATHAATAIYGVSDDGGLNKQPKMGLPVVALSPVGAVSADGELQRQYGAGPSNSLILMLVQPQDISATMKVSRSALFCNR